MAEHTKEEGVEIPQPKWPLDDGLEPLYANHFSVTRTPHEIVLVFGEFIPTGFSGRSIEEVKAFMETVEVRPLSKIIVSPAGAKALLAVMNDTLKNLAGDEKEAR